MSGNWKQVRLEFALKKSLKTKEHAPMPNECKRTPGEYFGFMEAWDIAVQNDPRILESIRSIRNILRVVQPKDSGEREYAMSDEEYIAKQCYRALKAFEGGEK